MVGRSTRLRRSAQQGSPWNHVPAEILSLIVSKCVTSAAQYVSLRHVCREWRRSLTDYYRLPPLPSPQLPFLLLPRPDSDPRSPLGHVFPLPFSHPFRRPTTFSLPQLEGTRGCICVGSSHGWLITLGRDSSLSLLNPVTGGLIHLPPLSSINNTVLYFDSSFYTRYHLPQKRKYNSQISVIHRAILSSDPVKDPGFIVLLFLSDLIDCCFTCGKDSVTWSQHLHKPFLIEDVIFFNGVFVAIDLSIDVAVFDFTNITTGLVMKQRNLIHLSPQEAFLVEAAGDLLLVVKWVKFNRPRMPRESVQVFMIVTLGDEADGSTTAPVVGVASLSQRALFVGHGCSVSVSVRLFPRIAEGAVYFPHVHTKLKKVKVGREIRWHHVSVYKFIIKGDVTRKVFSVEHRMFSPLWTNLTRFRWVTPNLNRT